MQQFFTRLISWILLTIMTAFGYGIRDYSENAFRVPGLEDGFIPQGICESDDFFYISGYFNDKNASRLYVVNPENGEQVSYASLVNADETPFTGHCGGIACVGNYVYVASGNSLWLVSKDELLLAGGKPIHFLAELPTNVKASFAFYAENTLWVGEFHIEGEYETAPEHHGSDGNCAWVMGYALDETGLPVFEGDNQPAIDENGLPVFDTVGKMIPKAMFTVPDKTQGMTILEDGTIVVSVSFGRRNTSYLMTYDRGISESTTVGGYSIPKYALTESKRHLRLRLPPMSECIEFYDGKVYILFESGATAYANASEIIPYVWKSDLVALLDKLRRGPFGE